MTSSFAWTRPREVEEGEAAAAVTRAHRVLPDDHRPAPVQVDSHVLSFHRGLLLAS
jgi:hypothetical protein